MKPFFSYYGAKFRAAKHYPHPRHGAIIEPFAGSAAYACQLSGTRQTILVEKDPVIAGLWKYLQGAKYDEIIRLPDLEEGQAVDDLRICQEAKWLIGFWVNKGSAYPKQTISKWAREGLSPSQYWGPRKRKVIASQLHHIRAWKIIEGDYTAAPDIECTWFIDPPYFERGYAYRCNKINYADLAEWCKSRKGQVIVCEQERADWLPFQTLRSMKSNQKHGFTSEAIYYKGPINEPQLTLFRDLK